MYEHVEMIVNYVTSDDGRVYKYSSNQGVLTRCSNCYLADGKARKCTLTGLDIDELDYCSKARKKSQTFYSDVKCKDCQYASRSWSKEGLVCIGRKEPERVEEDHSCGEGKLKVKSTIEAKVDIDVIGITLLSDKEADHLSEEILSIGGWWCLRSPGNDVDLVEAVAPDGSIYFSGISVHYGDFVRPALQISPNKIKTGDKFALFGYTWTVVLDSLALCDTYIGVHRYDAISNNWETSELKRWIEKWLKDRTI